VVPRGAGSGAAQGRIVTAARHSERLPLARERVRGRTALRGVLSEFQATMLRWRELHPYNAVHAVAIDPEIGSGTLERAIAAELTHCGLTGLVVDRDRKRYEYRGGPAQVSVGRTRGPKVLETLESEIERQLNTPFPASEALDPFRFFVVSGDDGTMLGVAYDHFIAGGDCIIALLHAIVGRCAGPPPDTPRPLLYPPTQTWLFLRHWPRLVGGLARLPALVRSARSTARPRYRDIEDGYNGYALYRLDGGEYPRLVAAAKAWSVTMNDLLLALLLLALDPLTSWRQRSPRRRALAVASIMNLRAEYGDAGQAAFGQFLSSLRVSHPVPPGATLRSVAQDVHAETTRVKQRKLYLQPLLAMRYVSTVWPMLSPKQRAGFYAKSYPIWAGVSALNVNALWPQQNAGDRTPVYIRGVPTGPLAPIVLAVTTVGEVLYGGVSYRTAAFSRADIDQLWSGLVRRLDELP
jgi:hypothetical protein